MSRDAEAAVGHPAGSQRQYVADLVTDPATARFIFIARSEAGEYASTARISNQSGVEEAELLAEYVAAACDRSGTPRDEFLRELVSELNARPSFEADGGE